MVQREENQIENPWSADIIGGSSRGTTMDSGNDTECPDRSLVKHCRAGKTDNT